MRAETRRVADIDDRLAAAMFAVFQRYYDGVDETVFRDDLAAKDRVILLTEDGATRGFSTIAIRTVNAGNRPVRVVFSGDTIIDRNRWGSQTFAFAWIREIARIKAEQPEIPLYWLLISKGYRTYRYLEAFSLAFTPDWRGPADPALESLKHRIAVAMFGAAYDPARGIVAGNGGRLAPGHGEIGPRELRRADVRFFVERNPGHARGDELVCLCSLDKENMKPLTRRIFLKELALCGRI